MTIRTFLALIACSTLTIGGCGGKSSNEAPAAGASAKEAELQKVAEQAVRAQRHEDLLASGKRALDAKRFDEAIKDFEEAVRLQDSPQARAMLQQAQKGDGDARKAAYDTAMLLGARARKEHSFSAAISAYQEALRQSPNDQQATAALQEAEFSDYLEKGRAALEKEQLEVALQSLGEATRRRPDHVECRDLYKRAQGRQRVRFIAQGQAAMSARQYSQAVQVFTRAKELWIDAELTALIDEANFQAKLQLGRQRVETNQFAVAIPELEEAVRLKPERIEARDLLHRAREGKRLQDKAEFDRALAAGDLAMQRKDYPAAIRAYREGLTRHPQDGAAASKLAQAENAKAKKESYDRHMAEGKTQLSLKNYIAAEREFAVAVAEIPGDLESRRLLQEVQNARTAAFQAKLLQGRQHLEANQFAAAILDLEEALVLKPGHAEIQELLRRAKEGKKRQDKTEFDRAIAVGDAAMQRKDYQAAINAYREALTRLPQDAIATAKLTQAQTAKAKKDLYDRHMSLGKSHLAAKSYRSAESEFQAALTDQANDPEAQRLLKEAQSGKAKKESYDRHISQGKTYLTAKNYRMAETEFQAALNDMPGDAEANRLLTQAKQGKR